MSLPEELAGFSREELIELVGRLLGHIQVLEARIAELEDQQKPPTGVKERKPPSWVKANRPARPKGERRKRENGGSGPTALPGDETSPPTGWNTPRPAAPTARFL